MICDACNEDKEDVQECEDPYSKEINEEIILTTLCDDCYQERVDEI